MYQLGKFARRNRALVTGLAVAAIALLAGTVASTALAIRARAAERIADERRADAVRSSALAEQRRAQADSATRLAERRRAVADSAFTVADAARATAERERVAATQSAARAAREAEKSTAVNGFLQRMLTSADPAVAQGAELTVREMLDLAATEGRRDATSRPPEVRAAIDAALGRTYVSLGLFDAARPFLDSAYAVRRRLLGPRDVAVAESADDLGKLAYSVNNAAVAEQRLTEALSTLRATRPPSDDRIVSVVRSLGDVRQRQGRFAAAESLYRDGIRRARIQRPDGGPIVGEMMQSLGSLLAYTGRAREAVALLDTSLTMVRAAYGPSHPQVVWTMTALSDAWGGVPDFPRREAVVREALPIARRIFGDRDHPTIADLTSRLGEVLAQQGRFEEAEAPQRGALRMRIAVLGEPHPDVQLSRQNLGRMLQNTGRMAEADTLFGQALLARRATLGAQSPAVASSLVDIAILAMRREEWARAERAYREARDIWRAAQIADQELYTLAELSLSIARQGRTEQADSILADVLVGRRSRFGDAHWSVGDTYAKQADVAAMRGDFACADSFMVRALAVAEKVYGPRGLPVLGMRLSRATHAEWRGDTTAAVALLREPADVVAARPPTDLPRLNVQRQFATNLCATGAVAQGDSLLRDIVAAMPVDGVRDMPYRLRGALGYCRLRAGRFPESEALLLEAERGLAGFQPAFARTHGIVVSWLVSLYEQWGKPEQVARWRGARRGSGGGGR
jgi:tetratricopeptide (TPR) repeat protein